MTIANAAGRRVAASDVIQIHVLNQPDLDRKCGFAPDGTISVPYVGRIRAAGLTEDVIAALQEGPNKRRHSQMTALN